MKKQNQVVSYFKTGLKDALSDLLYTGILLTIFFALGFIIGSLAQLNIVLDFNNPSQTSRAGIIVFLISAVITIFVKGWMLQKIYKWR